VRLYDPRATQERFREAAEIAEIAEIAEYS